MAKPIRISGDIDFNKLLRRLSDDIVKAPAFLRMHKELREHFAKHEDEINQSPFFWAMVDESIWITGWSTLARIYDQEQNALSLRSLLLTIEANKYLFYDDAVIKRIAPSNPTFVENIVPGSHLPESTILLQDLSLVSDDDPLVHKVVLWRGNFGAHTSSKQTIKRTLSETDLPSQDEALALCERAFDVFNRYSSLFHAVHHSRMIINEKGSMESVFRYLRRGLAACREDQDRATEELLKALKIGKPA